MMLDISNLIKIETLSKFLRQGKFEEAAKVIDRFF